MKKILKLFVSNKLPLIMNLWRDKYSLVMQELLMMFSLNKMQLMREQKKERKEKKEEPQNQVKKIFY